MGFQFNEDVEEIFWRIHGSNRSGFWRKEEQGYFFSRTMSLIIVINFQFSLVLIQLHETVPFTSSWSAFSLAAFRTSLCFISTIHIKITTEQDTLLKQTFDEGLPMFLREESISFRGIFLFSTSIISLQWQKPVRSELLVMGWFLLVDSRIWYWWDTMLWYDSIDEHKIDYKKLIQW